MSVSNQVLKPGRLEKIKSEFIIPSGYKVAEEDMQRPWGGFWRISSDQAEQFVDQFFPNLTAEELGKYGTELSPKILAVEPGQQLSLQYHRRRAEIWRVIAGPVLVALSNKRHQGLWVAYEAGQQLEIPPLTTHRLSAPEAGEWGIIAEVWQHTDSRDPSDEADITRIADDYDRQ